MCKPGRRASLIRQYSAALDTCPVLTKSLTASSIFGLSDVVAQIIEQSGAGAFVMDQPRVLMNLAVGFCFGPAAHVWYAVMQHAFPRSNMPSVLIKTTLGQTIFGPVFTVVYFAAALIAERGPPGLKLLPFKVSQDLMPTLLAGMGFWPFVDLVSYAVIARKKSGEAWIPLFANVCSFIWQVYLSMQARLTAVPPPKVASATTALAGGFERVGVAKVT